MTPQQVEAGLRQADYLPDEGLVAAVFLAIALKRPLLLEGEAGVGKTEVAKALATWTGGRLIRLQCYEGIGISQAVYEWDYARQILSLRAREAAAPAPPSAPPATATAPAPADSTAPPATAAPPAPAPEAELYSQRFLVKRPLLQAILPLEPSDTSPVQPPVLLIDEIDRADDEFEAYLLEVLSDWSVTIPELGTFAAQQPPICIITSNRTRDIHDALRRRCLYHWVEHPDLEREVAIVSLRANGVSQSLARQVSEAVARLREANFYKPPSVAESISWANALSALGADQLDEANAELTLGAVLKYKEDQNQARAVGLAEFVG